MVFRLLAGSVLILLTACALTDKDIYVDQGGGSRMSASTCGSQSMLNHFLVYNCASLEIEENNDYARESVPLHNIQTLPGKQAMKLFVVEEKLFSTDPSPQGDQVGCRHRLKVVLNPGSGPGPTFQKGWVTYNPRCMQVYRFKTVKGHVFRDKQFIKSAAK